MKVKKVAINNRKRAFDIVTSEGAYEFPFTRLRLPPSERDPIRKVEPDTEVGLQGFTYRLASGKEDTILIDQVLEYSKDPEYLRQALLFKLTLKAQKQMKTLGVSKREVIRRMDTTPTQFYRLMDQTNTRKTIDQMVRLLAALDCSVGVVFGAAA